MATKPSNTCFQPRIRRHVSNKLTGGLWCALAPAPRLIRSAHPSSCHPFAGQCALVVCALWLVGDQDA